MQKKAAQGRLTLDVFKIMIGQLHGDNVFNFLKRRNEIDFLLNRAGLDNGYNLVVRQHAMHFDTFKCGYFRRYGIGAPLITADNNS